MSTTTQHNAPTPDDFADEVFNRAEQMLRSELEWDQSTDDAVAQVFKDRFSIADSLCSKYPAGPQSAIDRAVSMYVTIDQLRETAGEILALRPVKVSKLVVTVPADVFDESDLPF
jgi:hypothetical protein